MTKNFPTSLISPSITHRASRFTFKVSRHQLLKALLNKRRPLDARQPAIKPVRGQQLLMRAALDDLALAHDQNLIRLADRAQAMGDHKAGAVGHEPLQGLLNEFLR